MSPKKPTKKEILKMQQPSIRALLTDNEDEARAYFQGLSSKIFVTQEDMDSGKVAKPKEMDINEHVNAVVHRQHRAGTQQETGYLGVLWKDNIDKERSQDSRDRAVDAFMKTPGVSAPSFEGLFARAAAKAKSVFRIKRKADIK